MRLVRCSLALVHGFGLADALRAHGDDYEHLALEMHAFTERELVPWFRAAVFQVVSTTTTDYSRFPTAVVTLVGWVVIAGGVLTASVAAELVTVVAPPPAVTTTV